MTLRISVIPEPHPYRQADDPRWNHELWGRLLITTDDDNVIVDKAADLGEFLEWFIQNHVAIVTEHLDIEGDQPRKGETLTEALDRMDRMMGDLADSDIPIAERRYEKLRQYRRRHQINEGLPGSGVAPWIVGPNVGGEISRSNGSVIAFDADLREFVRSICASGISFIQASLGAGPPREAAERGHRILRALETLCAEAAAREDSV